MRRPSDEARLMPGEYVMNEMAAGELEEMRRLPDIEELNDG